MLTRLRLESMAPGACDVPYVTKPSGGPMKQDFKTIAKATYQGVVVGVAIALLGYLLSVTGGGSYGLVVFCLLPFLTGFSVALLIRPPGLLVACLLTVGILSGLLLIFTGLEGYICVAMAAPIMAVGMSVGALIGFLVMKNKRERQRVNSNKTPLLILALPLLLAAAEHVERPFRNASRRETFTTTIHLNAPPERTWNSLTELPELSGSKPFLLVIGLPVPTHCTLQENEVGGERICVFDQGVMKQRVSHWEPATRLQVEVTESTLPGRLWLEFLDAAYELTPTATGTTLTRTSTIDSRLYPRWYWRGFEAWAVSSEHDYVLSNIQRRAESP